MRSCAKTKFIATFLRKRLLSYRNGRAGERAKEAIYQNYKAKRKVEKQLGVH
jgi:hypothetical protein